MANKAKLTKEILSKDIQDFPNDSLKDRATRLGFHLSTVSIAMHKYGFSEKVPHAGARNKIQEPQLIMDFIQHFVNKHQKKPKISAIAKAFGLSYYVIDSFIKKHQLEEQIQRINSERKKND